MMSKKKLISLKTKIKKESKQTQCLTNLISILKLIKHKTRIL